MWGSDTYAPALKLAKASINGATVKDFPFTFPTSTRGATSTTTVTGTWLTDFANANSIKLYTVTELPANYASYSKITIKITATKKV